MGKRFNRYIKNVTRYQTRSGTFYPNRLNMTLSIEQRDGREILTNSGFAVLVDCNLKLDAEGLQVDVASDSEQLSGTFEKMHPISVNDLVGFPYDVREKAKKKEPLCDDDHYSFWEDEERWGDELKAIYSAWGLEYGHIYWFPNAVLKASDELVRVVKENSSNRFDLVQATTAEYDEEE
jgi:hypothetical protein